MFKVGDIVRKVDGVKFYVVKDVGDNGYIYAFCYKETNLYEHSEKFTLVENLSPGSTLAHIGYSGVPIKIVGVEGRSVYLEGTFFAAHICNFSLYVPDPVIKAWGDTLDFSFNYSSNKIKDFLTDTANVLVGCDSSRVLVFDPILSENYDGKVSIFLNAKDKANARRTAMKPGRAFKRMFPELSDADLATLVDKFRYKFSPREYKIFIGSEKENFKKAYAGDRCEMENPYTTSRRKSLGSSCMRDSFDHLDMHPAEVYASGDFSIVWVEDNKGKIAARCVVRTDTSPWQYGPIYGVCERSIDMVELFLREKGADDARGSSWDGARLLRVPQGEDFIGPYLDVGDQELYDDGEFLVIGEGPIDASDYQGFLTQRDCICCPSCGDRVHEDDLYYSEYLGDSYCQDCYYEEHENCSVTGYYYHTNEMVSAYFHANNRRGFEAQQAHEGCVGVDIFECAETGDLYHEDLLEYETHDGEFVNIFTVRSEYFVCAESGLYYPQSMGKTIVTDVETLVGEVPQGFELSDDGKYYKNEEVEA